METGEPATASEEAAEFCDTGFALDSQRNLAIPSNPDTRAPWAFACGDGRASDLGEAHVVGSRGTRQLTKEGDELIERLRQKLSYANVVATLALFIALSGTSYAALQLTGRDIRDGSLSGRELLRNSVGSRPIMESALGTVPRAQDARRLNGLTASRLLLHCPNDTVPVSDVCVERTSRPSAPYGIAAVACEMVKRRQTPGRRLPSHDELMTAIGDFGITLAGDGELTRNVYPSSANPGGLDVLYITEPGGSVALTRDTAAGAKAFRCVTDPLN